MNAPAPSVNDVIDALADALAQRVADRLALREPEHASPRGTEPAYLSEQEAARRTRLSRRTLQGWRARGEGPRYVKLGRAVRYPIRDRGVRGGGAPIERAAASSTPPPRAIQDRITTAPRV